MIIKIYHKIKNSHQWLASSGLFFLLLFFLFSILGQIDDRVLMGVNIWLKPAKFALSGVIFNWTIALLLPLYLYSYKKSKRMGNILAFAMLIEILIIGVQAARGEMSHYNFSTPLNGIIFMTMGIGIATISIILIILFIDSFRKKLNTSSGMLWGIRFAWIAVIFALIGGQMMIGNMSHCVNIPDGGDGLPITNWSTIGGDLRVMHFLGLHAIQILPLSILFLEKYKFTKNNIIYFSFLIGSIYLGIIIFTWWQAMNGMPLLKA